MRRRPNILTRAVLAQIPEMVASGRYRNRQAIADALGCKLNTLQVRCSQNGIRLRPGAGNREQYSMIRLSRASIDRLHEYAVKHGETDQSLARRLIEIIVRDNLYDAILDDKAEDKVAA